MPPIATDEYRMYSNMNQSNSQSKSRTEIVARKQSSRSLNKKKHSNYSGSDSDSVSASSYYKSDRSETMNMEKRKSFSSKSLTAFYSSRRSVVSNQANFKVISKNSVLEEEKPSIDRSWNENEGQKPDTSPRRPTKQRSFDSVSIPQQLSNQSQSEEIVTPRRASVDTSPRKPLSRRLDFDPPSGSRNELVDTPPRRFSRRLSVDITIDDSSDQQSEARDLSPRKPRQRTSLTDSDSSPDQEIFMSFPESATPKTDNIPKQPQHRGSIKKVSTVNKEIQFSPDSSVLETKSKTRKQFIVEVPSEKELNEYIGKKSRGGCGNSVTSDISCQSSDEKLYSRLKMSITSNYSTLHQRNLLLRRQASQQSIDSIISQVKSITTKDSSSNGSVMSIQSHLSLSMKIRTLIELAADVVNSENLDLAAKNYQKSIHAAGSEIMNINIQMGNMLGDDSSASATARSGCHEDLRLIGIIIGMLRTKMAILYGGIGEYDRAIDLCVGAVQVHRHQPVLKSISSNLSDMDDVAGLMVLIIERLENSQMCFEGHKELLDKIDRHSGQCTESEAVSSKEIVLSMLEKSTVESLNIQDDVFEVMSLHTAKQDKHNEGIMYLRDALQIHLVALGLKHPQTSKSLLNVARMYRGFGNDRTNENLVLGYFQQTAAVLHRSNLSQQSRVSVLNDIAVIHMRRKMYDEAIKFLLDALHAYDESIEDDTVKRGHHIATLQIWRNLGECYMQLFKFKSAEGALLKALHIQRDCVKVHEAAERIEINSMKINESILNLSNDICIADTICQIGKARAGGGSYKQALEIYRESLRVLNRNSSADQDRSDAEVLKKRDQLTNLLYCIAEAERANDDLEKSLQMYLLSLRLRKTNGAEDIDKRKATRIHCLSCFLGIIDILIKQKKFDEAKQEIKSALAYAVRCQVKKTHPIVLAIRKKSKDCEQAISDTAMRNPDIDALEKKADTEIERGALDMATETLRQLLVIRRATLKEMKANGQDTKDQVYAIACLLQTFGFVFAKNGDDENAERAFKDASRLFRKRGHNIDPNDPNLVQI